jgi:hypothetical protein
MESTACDHDMEMGMKQQVLGPGMEYGREAHLGAESSVASAKGKQGIGGCLEQQVVEAFFVLEHQGVELVWEGEDHMEVMGRQQSLGAILEPSCLLEALAFGTVTVTAGVIRDAGISTAPVTELQMSP